MNHMPLKYLTLFKLFEGPILREIQKDLEYKIQTLHMKRQKRIWPLGMQSNSSAIKLQKTTKKLGEEHYCLSKRNVTNYKRTS